MSRPLRAVAWPTTLGGTRRRGERPAMGMLLAPLVAVVHAFADCQDAAWERFLDDDG
ncbi:hypothetical protein HC251_00605 [Iamia sp. SCSIO 61187]|uniref:hypothetical protein n=1 Tax=Iamia sp. SCSIO 61187 TaxID=2722752 RepID=UPI001C6357D2|nr:hypothetical protein [Iamia sp. SCSIO 61187]QYG91080.1 hypothetical protein HC251_00605 [Iamia sp. SCSIO 61187]